MLKSFKLVEGKLVECGTEGSCVSVYINPDEKEKAYLVNQALIDEHTFNSSLDPDEVGRIEFESNHLAAIIKKPKRYSSQDNFLFKVSSIGLFLFVDQLIVVTAENGSSFDKRIFSKMQSAKDAFLRIILDCIVHFEEHLKVIRRVSDELESEINQAFSNKDLLNMFKLEKSLVYYLEAINSNNKVIEKLKINSVKLGFSQEVNEFLEDLFIEGAQCYQQSNSYSQVLSSMMDAWASIINNNLNIRIKTLTTLSLCIMTPTFVVSLFSMNVPLPIPQEGTLVSFWVVCAMALLSVISIWLIWRYRKW